MIPKGKLVIRNITMPSDTNPEGVIAGGWIMSQMDIAGGLLAREISDSKIATIAVEVMKFIKPVNIGDTVCFYADVAKIGTTSITLDVEVRVELLLIRAKGSFKSYKVTEAKFTYVTLDENRLKTKIDR